MKTLNLSQARHQAGSVLLEAMFAILIFSMGILGLVGLQATAVKQAGDAKYRSDASLLANELIAQMWATDRTLATLQANFQDTTANGTSAYAKWAAQVQATLPGITAAANQPTVRITADTDPNATVVAGNVPSNIVVITISWRLPSETAAHQFVTQAQIK